MRKGTSGFALTEKESGAIVIEYVDFVVSEFGGSDYERSYYLDGENAAKLKSTLSLLHEGSLEEMIEAEFGRTFNDKRFWDFCREHGIAYSSSSWTSGADLYGEPY